MAIYDVAGVYFINETCRLPTAKIEDIGVRLGRRCQSSVVLEPLIGPSDNDLARAIWSKRQRLDHRGVGVDQDGVVISHAIDAGRVSYEGRKATQDNTGFFRDESLRLFRWSVDSHADHDVTLQTAVGAVQSQEAHGVENPQAGHRVNSHRADLDGTLECLVSGRHR
jgi:hypothetical protein